MSPVVPCRPLSSLSTFHHLGLSGSGPLCTGTPNNSRFITSSISLSPSHSLRNLTMDDDSEYRAVTATLRLFYTFRQHQRNTVVQPKTIKYNLLPPADQALLPFYPLLLRDLDQCIEINLAFTQELAMVAANDWGIPALPSDWAECSASDYDKVRSTLLQFAREWSADGAAERDRSFARVVGAACARFPKNGARGANLGEGRKPRARVLVPGCGLGRLVYEFVKCGFETQGNEVSYHMLVALGFALNRMPQAHGHSVFPYLHRLLHVARRLFQVRPVYVPDESAYEIFREEEGRKAAEKKEERNGADGAENGAEEMEGKRHPDTPSDSPMIDPLELMSMAAGSFVDLYGPVDDAYAADPAAAQFRAENAARFDVVATCFFLDTAPNVLDYLRTIHHCLADSGVWVNFGPLHWHFEGDLSAHMVQHATADGVKSVHTIMEGLELSRDELWELMDRVGFVVEESESDIRTTYASDVKALSNFEYGAEFWVARKKNPSGI